MAAGLQNLSKFLLVSDINICFSSTRSFGRKGLVIMYNALAEEKTFLQVAGVVKGPRFKFFHEKNSYIS